MPYALTIEMLIFLLKAFQKFLSVFGGHLISTNIPSIVEKSTNLYPRTSSPSWKRVPILGLLLKSEREIVPTKGAFTPNVKSMLSENPGGILGGSQC